jgi:sarcosine oxidase subunit gamma
VADLVAKSAFESVLPVRVGGVTIEEVPFETLTSLSPFGDASAFAAALKAAHGIAVPKPGRSTGRAGTRCIWFGRGEVMLAGPQPDAALAKHAAVVDQSDAWASVTVSGAGVVDVLARLVPIDLRESRFKRGHTARTLVQHMTASITRTGPQAFQIMVFRSMAGTLVHDLKGAMEAIAARG